MREGRFEFTRTDISEGSSFEYGNRTGRSGKYRKFRFGELSVRFKLGLSCKLGAPQISRLRRHLDIAMLKDIAGPNRCALRAYRTVRTIE